mgnify:CR=1 FL=1
MASGELTANYAGRPYYLRLRWWTVENNQGGNYSRYGWDLAAISKQGYGSYNYTCGNWYVHVAGHNWSGCTALVFGPSGDFGGKTIWLGSGETGAVGHDPNGYLDFQIAANHQAPGPFNMADIGWHWRSGDRIPKAPGAPRNLRLRAGTLGIQCAGIDYDRGPTNGAAITADQVQWSTTSNFSNIVWTDGTGAPGNGPAGYSNPCGAGLPSLLVPGTTYYVRARSDAYGVGWSGWSTTFQFTTLPSTAPTLQLVAAPNGRNVTVTVTPPNNLSGVTKYRTEVRVKGEGTIRWWELTYSRFGAGYVTNTPGQTYEFRSSVFFGEYQTPYTPWIEVTLPIPNTDPGAYFDGDTPDTPALTYVWVSAGTNLWTSIARGRPVLGFNSFTDAAAGSGGTGVVFQASGGWAGSFGARALFKTDAASSGFAFGQDSGSTYRSDVEPGSSYYGSAYVMPSRAQRLQARITWLTDAGAVISHVAGPAVVAQPNVFTRLTVNDVIAPDTAQWAVVRVIDVGGTGWANWKGGEWLQVDGLMITFRDLFPYFDGSTADNNDFIYEWEGGTHSSVSRRRANTLFTVDPLADPDCPAPPSAPLPPGIENDCIEEVGTWRRYWAIIPEEQVSDTQTMIPTIQVMTGESNTRQVRLRLYENPLNQDPYDFAADRWVSEQIISYVPQTTTITLDGLDQRAYASVSGGNNIPADKLLYGSNGGPASWPVMKCGLGYLLSFDVPLETPIGNVSVGVALTRKV